MIRTNGGILYGRAYPDFDALDDDDDIPNNRYNFEFPKFNFQAIAINKAIFSVRLNKAV